MAPCASGKSSVMYGTRSRSLTIHILSKTLEAKRRDSVFCWLSCRQDKTLPSKWMFVNTLDGLGLFSPQQLGFENNIVICFSSGADPAPVTRVPHVLTRDSGEGYGFIVDFRVRKNAGCETDQLSCSPPPWDTRKSGGFRDRRAWCMRR